MRRARGGATKQEWHARAGAHLQPPAEDLLFVGARPGKHVVGALGRGVEPELHERKRVAVLLVQAQQPVMRVGAAVRDPHALQRAAERLAVAAHEELSVPQARAPRRLGQGRAEVGSVRRVPDRAQEGVLRGVCALFWRRERVRAVGFGVPSDAVHGRVRVPVVPRCAFAGRSQGAAKNIFF